MSAPAPAGGAGGVQKKKRKTYGERKQLAKVKRAKAAEAMNAEEAAAFAAAGGGAASGSDDSSDSSDSDSEDGGVAAAPKAKKGPPTTSGHLKNCPMLLVTCDSGKEQLCKKEMMSWLIDFADQHYPRKAAATEPAKPASISGGLAAELAALQAEQSLQTSSTVASAASSRALGVRFKVVPDMQMFGGLILIAVLDPDLPIVRMVEGMLDEVTQTKTFRTRYSVHLHPFQMTCYSEMDAVLRMAEAVVPPAFQAILDDARMDGKRKFSVEWIRRGCHSQMDRMKVIDHIAHTVAGGPPKPSEGDAAAKGDTTAAATPTDTPAAPVKKSEFTVDLKKPDIVVLVEVLGRLTGLSVYTSYHARLKYNLRSLFESLMGFKQEAEKKSPEDQAAAQAAGKERKRKAQEQREMEERNKKAKQERLAKAAAEAAQPPVESAAVEQKADTTTTTPEVAPAAAASEATPMQQ